MLAFFDWEPRALAVIAFSCLFAYCMCLGVYRLYFHPLAKFPGPKLAALSDWYEVYYDVFQRGNFIWKLHELHDKYGPIIRITPHELHIRDSDFNDEIYAPASKKRDKYDRWVVQSVTPQAGFSTVEHELHRLRRGALNQFFSKRTVSSLEPDIMKKVEHLCSRFEEAYKSQQVIRSDTAYTALTMDIIAQYAYGENYDYLSDPGFKQEWRDTLSSSISQSCMIRHFPWLADIFQNVPIPILQVIEPGGAIMMKWHGQVKEQIVAIKKAYSQGDKGKSSIFKAILDDSSLPPQEKTVDRLMDEAVLVTGAGSETTAKSLAFITFYLYLYPEKLARLREELRKVMPTPKSKITWSELEQLPYLSAVITEGIRLMFGIVTRLPRVAHEPLKYKDWIIPPKTPISQSNYFVHTDPKIFPDPLEFKPERWLEAAESGFPLKKYFVSFSKGSRQCVGLNLAYAEIYLTVAAVVRRFEIENFETTEDKDIRMYRDYFVANAKPESKGIRIKIAGIIEK